MKIWMLLFCVETGVVVGVIRGIQLGIGYEADTQLPVPGNPLLWVVAALLIAFAVVIFFVARKAQPKWELDFVQCFRCVNTGYKVFGVICGLVFLAAGATGLYVYINQMHEAQAYYWETGRILNSYMPMQAWPTLLHWVAAIITGVCLVGILAMQSKLAIGLGSGIWLIPPMAWAGLLLVSCYLEDSSIPTVSLYVFLALAILMVMLAYRDFAAFAHTSKVPVHQFLFTSSNAIVLSMVEIISRLWNFFLQNNTMELTLMMGLKLLLLGVSSIFLLCNQAILLSNLEYQDSVQLVPIQVKEAPEEQLEKRTKEAVLETAEDIVKEFSEEETENTEEKQTTQE